MNDKYIAEQVRSELSEINESCENMSEYIITIVLKHCNCYPEWSNATRTLSKHVAEQCRNLLAKHKESVWILESELDKVACNRDAYQRNKMRYIENIAALREENHALRETIKKFSENAKIFKQIIDAAKYHADKGHNKKD